MIEILATILSANYDDSNTFEQDAETIINELWAAGYKIVPIVNNCVTVDDTEITEQVLDMFDITEQVLDMPDI